MNSSNLLVVRAGFGVLDDMLICIYRRRYAPSAGDTYCDALTRAAQGEGRPAFWSLATYHRGHFVDAACSANRFGLERACAELAAVTGRRGCPTLAAIAAFLECLAPANEAGREDLEAMRMVLAANEKPIRERL